jgi:hypothetical protein
VPPWPRKDIRFSVHAPRAENSYVLAECGLKLRERTKRADIGGRNRTHFRFADRNREAGLPSAPSRVWRRDKPDGTDVSMLAVARA